MINGITPAFSVRNTRILDWGKQVKLKLFLDLAVGQISTTVYDGQWSCLDTNRWGYFDANRRWYFHTTI